ncbi:protein of unknown function (plasmid) [Caballeronia sp. S22]
MTNAKSRHSSIGSTLSRRPRSNRISSSSASASRTLNARWRRKSRRPRPKVDASRPTKSTRTLRRLDDLRRTTPKDRDSRIFLGHYAPVLVVENGQYVVKPCGTSAASRASRRATMLGTPKPTTRRDNLEGF